jgi:hypothetical protein
MAMAVTVTVPVESVRTSAEAAIGDPLARRDRPSVQVAPHFTRESRAAVTSLRKSQRHGADGSATHHGQDDAARAFHGAAFG